MPETTSCKLPESMLPVTTSRRLKCPALTGVYTPVSYTHLKRRPNLGDALDALNSVMLTAIEANYGREKANEYDLLNARFSEEVRRFSGGRLQ